jgi:ribosome-binding protein aMBF1 (putative translation factor)
MPRDLDPEKQPSRRRRAGGAKSPHVIRKRSPCSSATPDLEGEVRTIGCAIKYWRQLCDLTQETLAARIGISQELLSRYELGRVRGIPYRRLGQIARGLDIAIDALLEGDHASPDALSTTARREVV